MNALELPMIHDQEGRVNEYEQKTLNDLHPLPGDSNPKVAQKRQAYESFIQNKSSAPLAKSHGIDLQNFQSTSTNPELSMTPQQRQMLAIARTNPNHPNAKLIFKKLGVQQ
jgi:hypothetical protein